MLDALNGWRLVREAAQSLWRPVATSFKDVSPAGAAIAGEVDAVMQTTWDIDAPALSPVDTFSAATRRR